MISINWETRVITVPRTYGTLVQSNPIEIRDIDLNTFRISLKDLEDSKEGIPYLNTHTHNTEVLLGGVVYARIIEIINNYTVTFEDGQYAVNLINANSNVADSVNINQVSVRTFNAAGLISNSNLEFSSFDGGVSIDTTTNNQGTTFPVGTPNFPVNNIDDALLIARSRNFNHFFVNNNLTINKNIDISDFIIIGEGSKYTTINVATFSTIDGLNIRKSTISGIMGDNMIIEDSLVKDINNFSGEILNSTLSGEIILSGENNTSIENSKESIVNTIDSPCINFDDSGHSLDIKGFDGNINIKNKTKFGTLNINSNSGGIVTLDPSITNGIIKLSGLMDVIDNTTGLTSVDTKLVSYTDLNQLSSFNGKIFIDTINGVTGTKFPLGTSQFPVNNIEDAIIISQHRNIKEIELFGEINIVDTDISNCIFIGKNPLNSIINLNGSDNLMEKTNFRNLYLKGELTENIYVEDCIIQSLTNIGSEIFPTIFINCIIQFDEDINTPSLKLKEDINDSSTIHIINCVSGSSGDQSITLDFNNSDLSVVFRKHSGGIKIENFDQGQDCSFEFAQGQIIIEPSCTNGYIRLGGNYKLTDNGTLSLEERNNIDDKLSKINKNVRKSSLLIPSDDNI